VQIPRGELLADAVVQVLPDAALLDCGAFQHCRSSCRRSLRSLMIPVKPASPAQSHLADRKPHRNVVPSRFFASSSRPMPMMFALPVRR
jgi:hypothetical protein